MESKPQTVKWPVKVWWIAHVILITLWCLPRAPQAVRQGRVSGGVGDMFLNWNENTVRSGPTHYYLTSTGLWQYWDMFAPDPLQVDYFVTSDIQFQDGTVKRVDFPRMSQMNIGQKYVKERYRKYIERAHSDEYVYLWPVVSQWLATQATTGSNNPAVGVNLILSSRLNPRPTADPDPNQPYREELLFSHPVDQTALALDKGWTKP